MDNDFPLNLDIDDAGYMYLAGIKVARIIDERGTVQFYDGNRARAEKRGTPFVEFPIAEIMTLAHHVTALIEARRVRLYGAQPTNGKASKLPE